MRQTINEYIHTEFGLIVFSIILSCCLNVSLEETPIVLNFCIDLWFAMIAHLLCQLSQWENSYLQDPRSNDFPYI